jgi:aryl-alcohol dehydrogenase-like predicted oxidoreductase
MEKRALGNSGLEIMPLIFGGNVLGWTADEAMSFKLLDGFVGAGLDAIDTADVYSKWAPGNKGGESEIIIGKWLKARGNRSKVVIATKAGNEMAPDKKGLSKAYVLRAVEESLKRLQTDYIDLYQSHIDDASTPLDETLSAYQQLIQQGKVRAIGCSNYTAPRLAEALEASAAKKLPRYESLQPHYNLYERAGFEAGLEQLCLKEKVGVIPYYSLASGFLTGKYRSEADAGKSPRGTRAKTYLNERGLRILKALDEVAARTRSKPGQVALAWLMARPSITAPIASATTMAQLEDLVASTGLKLDAAAIKELDVASA